MPASYGSLNAKDFISGAEILPVEEGEEPEDLEEESREKDWIDGEWKDVERAPEEDLDEDEIKGTGLNLRNLSRIILIMIRYLFFENNFLRERIAVASDML